MSKSPGRVKVLYYVNIKYIFIINQKLHSRVINNILIEQTTIL